MGIRRQILAADEAMGAHGPPALDPGGVREAQALKALADRSQSERQHLDAVLALKRYGTDQSVEALRGVLVWTEHVRVRHAAVMTLGRIGTPEAIDAIVAALDFADWVTVARAATILRVRDERRAIPAIVNCLVNRGEEFGSSGRVALLQQLCRMPSTLSIDPLSPLLRHRDRKTRREAANAIGAIGDAAALAALDAAVADLSLIRGIRANIWADHLRKKAIALPGDHADDTSTESTTTRRSPDQ